MTEPIEVTIRNNTNGSLHISWLRGRSYIVSEGKALRVNYEPWSCADTSQRRAMVCALGNGSVDFTMHLLTADGVKDIPYDPSKGYEGASVTTAAAKPAPAPLKVANNTRLARGSSEFASTLGFTAEAVTPPGDHDLGEVYYNKATSADDGTVVEIDAPVDTTESPEVGKKRRKH